MAILLAPMEGLLDCVLRDVLTRVGGVDLCVSEFIRVTGTLLPERAFRRIVPELDTGGRTAAGVAVRALVRDRDAARKSAERILEWPIQRVIVAHNSIVEADAYGRMHRALAPFLR